MIVLLILIKTAMLTKVMPDIYKSVWGFFCKPYCVRIRTQRNPRADGTTYIWLHTVCCENIVCRLHCQPDVHFTKTMAFSFQQQD